jgi:hypothetical protein
VILSTAVSSGFTSHRFRERKSVRELRLHIILAVSLLVLGCSGLEVSQDYDVKTDFSSLKSFAWKSEQQSRTGDIRVDNPLLDERVRTAAERTLMAKGFLKDTGGTPDFIISYAIQIRRRIESERVRTTIGLGSGGGGGFGGVGVSTGGGVSEYDEGMLVIDVTDPGTGDLLWRGTGIRRLPRRSNPEQNAAHVDETVEKILAQFPPQPT